MRPEIDFSMFSLFLSFMDRFNHGNISKTRKQSNPKASNSDKSLQMVTSVVSEKWATMSSTIASLTFAWAIICQYSPYEIRKIIENLKLSLKDYLNPYIKLSIHEATDDRMKRGEAYLLVEAYLSSIASKDAKRLRADMEKEGSDLVISMGDYQEVTDEFRGGKFWWSLRRVSKSQNVIYYEQGKRYYVLTFHRKYREVVTKYYLEHVMKQGKEVRASSRQRKLYTNIANSSRMSTSIWSHVVFEHPARLENMALDPELKEDIFEDLVAFSRNKEFYERAGKAWKRGYLLYGPPGTGKSTMVAAMANLLNYDVYDLELTAVKDNTELRKLLIETTSKSIIVIEDIDCSLDLTGQRKKKEEKSLTEDDNQDKVESKKKIRKQAKDDGSSRVTLSGLLNFIDGIWSSCGGERLIVFTTNYVDKLDPALIRRGRMDKHIELSYCSFEGFKVLAKNYLGLESHQMFDKIESLIGEAKITPADVAENLVPKSRKDDPMICLSSLIEALEEAIQVEAKKRAEQTRDNGDEEVKAQKDKRTEKLE